MPRHRKERQRGPGALRGDGGSLRSVLTAFGSRHAASHASRRPPRSAGPGGVPARGGVPADPDLPARGGAPAREPGTCRARLAMARSLMVTPWFAAGAGIVIAAALAVDSPAALTYVPADPGVRCPVSGCTGAGSGHGPDLATATPGVPFSAGSGPRAGTSPGPALPGGAGPATQVGYQVVRRWSSGFVATITVPASARTNPWRLHLAFSSAHVDQVWGARWRSSGNGDAGTATGPWPGHGRGRGPGGESRLGDGQLMISATGTATTPSACRLDGVSCRFG
jgi:Cellulose binding domain